MRIFSFRGYEDNVIFSCNLQERYLSMMLNKMLMPSVEGVERLAGVKHYIVALTIGNNCNITRHE